LELRQPPEKKLFKRLWSNIWAKPLSIYEGELARYQCPNHKCLSILPKSGTGENITIAVIGDIYSGKTHFITAIIDQLRKLQVPGGYFDIIAASQEIEDKYQVLHRRLFDLQRPLELTQPTQLDIDQPLAFQIKIGNPDGTKRSFNLLFYDASGEDLARQTKLVQFKSHILKAQAIIFLADPWAMSEFIDRVAHYLRPETKPTRLSSEVLAWVIETFREVRPELAGDDFPLPTAIVLSKSDLIEYHPVLRDKYEHLWQPEYARLYNTDTDQIDALTRQFLNEIEEDNLLGKANSFNNVKFFAISATGSTPDDQNKYAQGVRPHRCLDPLLWIFRELDLMN
jgi:hypothetical protein